MSFVYFNICTIWDSRYKSSLIQADTYLLICQRYIELNPVRAAMVEDPADYRWSSYRAHALGELQSILTAHPLYFALGANDEERQRAYRALFRAHLDRAALDDIRLALNQSQPLGDSRFHAATARARNGGHPDHADGRAWRCVRTTLLTTRENCRSE